MSNPEKLEVRTLWISDTHLGTRACKAKMLHSFLKNVKAEKIYLVGDIVDGWALKSSWYWPSTHNNVVRTLIKIARSTEIIYIPGNHDEGAREFCPFNFGDICVKTWDTHTTLKEKRLAVLHGDIFDPFITKDKHLRWLGDWAYDVIIWLNNIHHTILKIFGLKYWSLAEHLKKQAREAIKAIDRFEKAAIGYANKKKFDGLVVGHIHEAALKNIDGKIYANSGDWVSNCTAIYEDYDGELGIIDWSKKN